MKKLKAENVRYHAAGHLALIHALIKANHIEAARCGLTIINQYVMHEKVNAPPQLKTKVEKALADPAAHLEDVALLEQWMVSPFNTAIERGAA